MPPNAITPTNAAAAAIGARTGPMKGIPTVASNAPAAAVAALLAIFFMPDANSIALLSAEAVVSAATRDCVPTIVAPVCAASPVVFNTAFLYQ